MLRETPSHLAKADTLRHLVLPSEQGCPGYFKAFSQEERNLGPSARGRALSRGVVALSEAETITAWIPPDVSGDQLRLLKPLATSLAELIIEEPQGRVPNITGSDLCIAVEPLQALEILDVAQLKTPLTISNVRKIFQLPRLRKIAFRGTHFDRGQATNDEQPTACLESILCFRCTFATRSTIALFSAAHSLRRLFLSQCKGVVDADADAIADNATITDLSLRDCSDLTDKALASLTRMTNLVTLDLSGCSFTSFAIGDIRALVNLRNLDLRNSEYIDDDAFHRLTRELPWCTVKWRD